jgi:hypothetical protein
MEVGARLAKLFLQESKAPLAQLTPCADAQRLHSCRCRGADAVEPCDFKPFNESGAALGPDDEHAVRLAHVAGHLGQELVVGNPGGSRQPGAGEDLCADRTGNVACRG